MPIQIPYLGNVATRCYVPNGTTGNTKVRCVTRHTATDTITALKLVFANWASTSSEAGNGGTCAYTAAIEYPQGTINGQVTFNASPQGIAAVASTLVSDLIPMAVPIPKRANFWVRTYAVNAGATMWTMNQLGSTLVDKLDVGSLIDHTMNPNVAIAAATTSIVAPAAILGYTANPTVGLLGDSMMQGSHDTNSSGDYEQGLCRTVGKVAGYINAACSGEQASSSGFIGAHTKRVALLQLANPTHVFCAYGRNDLNAGRTGAQLLADIATIAGYFPGVPFFQTTLPPETTSTDSWVTTGNQTVTAHEADRLIFNASVRNGTIAGLHGYFDIEAALESSYRSGLWRVQPGSIAPATAAFTDDGIHPIRTGYLSIQAANAVACDVLFR